MRRRLIQFVLPLLLCVLPFLAAGAIGSAIEDILLVAEYMPEEDIRDQVVVFLPLRG